MTLISVDQQRISRPSHLAALLVLGTASIYTSVSHASVKGEWADGVSRDLSFSRVLVVGVSPDRNQRCRFERAMASRIRSEDTVALVSCDVMPSDTPLTRASVEAVLAAENADAVFTTSLISTAWETEEGGTRDTRGNADYKASDAYYGYYGTVIAVDFQTSAPVITFEGTVEVTSKLFDARDATVVYTMDTRVRNIEAIDQGLAEITSEIGKRLQRVGLIR